MAVHDNSAISAVEKFTYLRSLVEGSAARAISGLQLTFANYSAALEVLRERFAQKQIIINSHMESLIKLKPVNVISDVKGIRAVLDSVEIQVQGLQSLGIDSAQHGALLIPIFMEKLPDELKLIVSRRNKDDWEQSSVLGAVKSEVEARERSGIQPTIEKTPPMRLTFHTGSNNATASALFSGDGKFSCLFKCHPTRSENSNQRRLARYQKTSATTSPFGKSCHCRMDFGEVIYWPGMNKDVEDYVSKCTICSSQPVQQGKELLICHELPNRPWEKIAVDLFDLNGTELVVTVD